MASNAFKGRQPARRQATIKLKTLNRPTAQDLIALFGKKRDNAKVILAEEAGLDSLMSLLNHEHVKIRALAEESLNALKKVENEVLMGDGGCKPLAEMLRFKNQQAQRDALWTLAILAGNSEANHEGIILDVGWQVILSRAKAQQLDIQRAAITLIANLSLNEENHDMIISEGGLDLMKNLAQQTSDLKIKRAICNAFANLATDDENVQAVISDGGLATIIAFTQYDDDELVCGAVHTLANLANAEDIKELIVKEGGLPPLIKLLKSFNVMILKGATTAIANLTSREENQQLMVDSEVLEPLVFLGRKSKNPEVQFRVAMAFNNLCANG